MTDAGFNHYFTGTPARAGERREIVVPIAGRPAVVETAPGVFSPSRIDPGTGVLLKKAPPPPTRGHLLDRDILDLGCGWGPIALTLATLAPDAEVWAVDVNERALALTSRNAARLGLRNVTACLPDAVPAPIRFAGLWSHPPIRIGKPALHALLQQWLPRLSDDASAWLVVQRHLGADSLAAWLTAQGYQVTRHASTQGYRVLRVQVGV